MESKTKKPSKPNIKGYFYDKRPDLVDKLLPQQLEMLQDSADISIKSQAYSVGRGGGKTMIGACTALWFADEYAKEIGQPVNVLLISAQTAIYDRMEEFFYWDKTLKPRLLHPPSGTAGYDIPRERFQLSDTRSIVRNALPTIKQIEGFRADVIVFDEAQDIPETIYHKALGCLMKDKVGKVIVIGTPFDEKKAATNWFINLVCNPKKRGYKLSQYSSLECPWNDAERWKMEWSPARLKAEGEGIPPTKEEIGVFPAGQVNECYHGDANREGGASSTTEVGIDFGNECSAYVLSERLSGTKRKILFYKTWEHGVMDIVTEEMAKLLKEQLPAIIKADSLPIEWRGKIERFYHDKPINYIDLTSRTMQEGRMLHIKEHMVGQMQRRIREKNLIIPDCYPEVKEKLSKYKRGMFHGDDLVDSILLSCYDSDIKPVVAPALHIPEQPKKLTTRYEAGFTITS